MGAQRLSEIQRARVLINEPLAATEWSRWAGKLDPPIDDETSSAMNHLLPYSEFSIDTDALALDERGRIVILDDVLLDNVGGGTLDGAPVRPTPPDAPPVLNRPTTEPILIDPVDFPRPFPIPVPQPGPGAE